jgi:hypothetical protein
MAGLVATGLMALAPACGQSNDEARESFDESALAQAEGQNRDIDISVVDGSSQACGGETCFFIGSEKNITHVWVRAEGCEPDDFAVEIDGHAAGPAEAGPPDCAGFGGTRYVTGGRNPTAEYFDTVTVCVTFDADVDPGEVAVQAKASATCEDLSTGTGECAPCVVECPPIPCECPKCEEHKDSCPCTDDPWCDACEEHKDECPCNEPPDCGMCPDPACE